MSNGGILTPSTSQLIMSNSIRPDSPNKIPFNNNNNNNLDYFKENSINNLGTSTIYSTSSSSIPLLQAPPMIPLPSPTVIAKYAHPHSPNPSHISQFSQSVNSNINSSSPKLLSSTTTSSYSTALSSPNLFQSTSQSSSPQFNSHQFQPTFISNSNSNFNHLSNSTSNFNHNNNNNNNNFLNSSYSHSSRPLPPLSSSSSNNLNSTISNPMQTYYRPIQNNEPTMTQLLNEQPSGLSAYNSRMTTEDNTMGSTTGVASWRKGQGFKEWEKVRLDSPEVRRKADVAQLFFYDHYFDLLTYIHARKERLSTFKSSVASRCLAPPQTNMEWNSYKGRERVLLRKRRIKLKLEQFHILTQVGQGGYGEVYLARHKESHQVVALKKMRKRTLLKMDEIRHVLTERDILASTNSPWLVRLLYAFQDPTHVYLAMDFIAGGDFRTLLNNSGVLKEEHAKFYISEMFCAVNELHKLGYIHRDLKPENFLIDPSGHIKLTDFGLAAGALNPGKIENMKHKLDEVKDREVIYRTTIEMKSLYKSIRMAEPRYADSVVGSPDYMAIETLRGQSYSFSVDYWSLGCILFEFLSGFPPFSGASSEETWSNLKNWNKCLRRPHYDRPEDKMFNLSDIGWSAITSLIASKEMRLSNMEDLKSHPFFRDVEWNSLRDGKAPFIPALDSEIDSGYFDDFTSEADMAKYAEVREKQKNVDKVREKEEKFGRGVWVGFTFKAKKEEVKELLDGDDELITLF